MCSSLTWWELWEYPLTFHKLSCWPEIPAATHRGEWAIQQEILSCLFSDEDTHCVLKKTFSPIPEDASQRTSLEQIPFGGLKLRKMNFTVSHFLLLACSQNPGILSNLLQIMYLHLSASFHGFDYFLKTAFSRFSLWETWCIVLSV